MKTYITASADETKKLAGKLATKIPHGVIALTGELGSGKTTFVQGFAKGLGIKEKIISPTFILIRQHKIPGSQRILFHVDLCRLEKVDTKSIGLDQLFSDSNNVVLIEWAEKIRDLLPKNTTWISFKTLNENQREITL